MFKELVKQSRSRRTFSAEEKLTRQTLLELCDVARYTPAAMNLQPLKYRLVSDGEEVARMTEITRWAASLTKKMPPEGRGPSGYIVICHDTTIAERKPIFMIDAGIVAQTIMLAAAEHGLGGCILASAKEEDLVEVLSLPDHLIPVLVLGLGVPTETVVLTEAVDGAVRYYRDEEDVHYVPKRPLSEIIIE